MSAAADSVTSEGGLRDADELLSLAGVDSWTRQRALKVLATDPEARASIRAKLNIAQDAASRIRELAGKSGELRDVKVATDAVSDALEKSVDLARSELARRISQGSLVLAHDVLEDLERIEPLSSKEFLKSVLAMEIYDSIADIIDQVLSSSASTETSTFSRLLKSEALKLGLATGAPVFCELASQFKHLQPRQLTSPNRMSTIESMEGLGVLEALSRRWHVDCVVAINRGAQMLGRYIATRLKLPEDRIGVTSSSGGDMIENDSLAVLRSGVCRNVLVLDDVSRTGRRLRGVHAMLTHEFPNSHFECASLVSTVHDAPIDGGLYGYAAKITKGDAVSLPWGSGASFKQRRDRYVFGEGKGSIYFNIKLAEAIQQDLAASGD